MLTLLWALWLWAGTWFYAEYAGFGYSKGFFYAVNIGYSVGWCYSDMTLNQLSKTFTVLYLITGYALLVILFILVTDEILQRTKQWFQTYIKAQILRIGEDDSEITFENLTEKYVFPTFATLNFFLFIMIGAGGSCYVLGWTVLDGVYFAASCTFMCGAYGLPSQATDNEYALAAGYTLCSTSALALVVAFQSQSIFIRMQHQRAEEAISQPARREEKLFMRDVGLSNRDEEIDKHEFLLLVIIRLQLVDYQLLKHIFETYVNHCIISSSADLLMVDMSL
jgi:hypothetical protein